MAIISINLESELSTHDTSKMNV